MVSTEDIVRPIALLYGSDDVGKKLLMQRLLGVEDAIQQNSATLNLNTKYYSADVSLRCVGGEFNIDSTAPPEAVILAFDCTRQSSYEAIVEWTERQDLSGAAISLCIANKMDKLADGDRILRPAWLDKARQWCNSEMIEYIEASASDNSVDELLSSAEDQQGLKRVKAALEAHMWPGLAMKDTPESSNPNPGVAQTRGSDLHDRVVEGNLAADPDGARDNSTGDSAGQYAPLISSFDAIGQNFLAEAMRLENSTGNDESEDAFEKLLQEMMNMRSMLQNLSGEDRRKAAGDMMLRMQEQLGLSDGESSEED